MYLCMNINTYMNSVTVLTICNCIYFFLEQFKKYLQEIKQSNEEEELRLFKLIVFGPPRVGKSSLFSVLVGENPKENLDSTGILNRHLFKVAVTQDGTKSKWDIIEIEAEIARLKALLEEKKARAEETKSKAEKDELKKHKPETPSLETTKVESKMLEQYDQPGSWSNIKKYTSTLMVCYDSGGQTEFFDIMPALATNPTGYIMVFDMSKDLEKPSKQNIVIKGKEYPTQFEISSVEMMKGAIAGIQSHCKSESLLIVGTHLNDCLSVEQKHKHVDCLSTEQKLKDIDKMIFYKDIISDKAQRFVKKRQAGKNTQYVHPIDNLDNSTGKNCIAQEIHSAIEDMSENYKEHEKIPITWHLFQLEIQLQLESNPKHKYISLKTCIECAKRCGIDLEKCKIDKILEYFHKLGIMLYYGKTVKEVSVVFSPQWLFERLSDIIFLKYTCENYDIEADIKRGIIKRKTFHDIYQNDIDADGHLTIDQLLEVFVSQKIIASFSNDKDSFFVPAILNPASPDMKCIPTENCQKVYKTLYVKFDQQYFPRVVFCCLATHFMEKGWNIQDDYRYSDKMIFQAPRSNYYVGLFDNKTELAVEAYQEKKHVPVSEISYLISKFITDFCAFIHISSTFKFGFACNKASCTHLACVDLQYPYLTENYCEKCNRSDKLHCDEMVWLISSQDVCDIFEIGYPQVYNLYYYVCILSVFEIFVRHILAVWLVCAWFHEISFVCMFLFVCLPLIACVK